MNPSTRVHGRAWARRHMRDMRVAFTTEAASVDVDPVTGRAVRSGPERAPVAAGALEADSSTDDMPGNQFGRRDFNMLVDTDEVNAGDRVRIVSSRYDTTLIGARGTVVVVERDPANPMRRIMVRMDDSK